MVLPSVSAEVWASTGPGRLPRSPASVPGVASRHPPAGGSRGSGAVRRCIRACAALTLLVAQVLADDHDATVATDHLALVADLLDARLDLHRSLPDRTPALPDAQVHGVQRGVGWVTCSGRRCDPERGRTGSAPPPPGPRGGSGCSAGASFPRC